MLLLLFFFFSGTFGCAPDSNAPEALRTAISFKMDVSPPASWTIPVTPGQTVFPQARSPQTARNRIRNDIQRSVSAILDQYKYPPNQVTCSPSAEAFVQGDLVTDECTGDGQLLSFDGTVYYTCSQEATQAIQRGKREVAAPLDTSTSAPSTAKPTPPADPVSLSCVFILDWDYLGNEATAGATYGIQNKFILNVTEMLYKRKEVAFAAVAGQFGYVSDSNVLFRDEKLSENIENFTVARSGHNAVTTYEVAYCDALEEINDYNVTRDGAKCLIFVVGKNYTCLEDSSRKRQKRQAGSTGVVTEQYTYAIGATINHATSPVGESFPIDGFKAETANKLVERVISMAVAAITSSASEATAPSSPSEGTTEGSTGSSPPSSEGTSESSTSPGTTTSLEGINTVSTASVASSNRPTVTTQEPATPSSTTTGAITQGASSSSTVTPGTSSTSSETTPRNDLSTRSTLTSSTASTTPITSPIIRHNAAMVFTVNCTSITPAPNQMWSKFLEKLQLSLAKSKVSFNKNLSL